MSLMSHVMEAKFVCELCLMDMIDLVRLILDSGMCGTGPVADVDPLLLLLTILPSNDMPDVDPSGQ